MEREAKLFVKQRKHNLISWSCTVLLIFTSFFSHLLSEKESLTAGKKEKSKEDANFICSVPYTDGKVKVVCSSFCFLKLFIPDRITHRAFCRFELNHLHFNFLFELVKTGGGEEREPSLEEALNLNYTVHCSTAVIIIIRVSSAIILLFFITQGPSYFAKTKLKTQLWLLTFPCPPPLFSCCCCGYCTMEMFS